MRTKGPAIALLPLISELQEALSLDSYSPTAHLALVSRKIINGADNIVLQQLPESGRKTLSRMMTTVSEGLTGRVSDAENALAELRMSLVVFKTSIEKAVEAHKAQEHAGPGF